MITYEWNEGTNSFRKKGVALQAEINRALYRKRGKKNLDIETQITIGCLDWLNTVPGVRCWRQNTGGVEYVSAEGKKRHVAFGEPGQADITGVGPNGVRIEIEVKRPGEVPTELQIEWQVLMFRLKAIAFWCDSLDDCMDGLKHAFRSRDWRWDPKWEVQ